MMKAYTDIEQSKKLTEILSTKSADMRYTPFGDTHPWFLNNDLLEVGAIPSWSLSALLEILPHCIDGRYWLTFGALTGNDGWFVCYEQDIDQYLEYYIAKSNLIDACYEMILKLYEEKLIGYDN